MYRYCLIFLGLMLLPISVFAHQIVNDVSKPISVSQADPVIVIQLPANQTTGYQWVLANYDTKKIKWLSYRYITPHTQLIGAGGKAEFTFKIKPNAFIVPEKLTLIF